MGNAYFAMLNYEPDDCEAIGCKEPVDEFGEYEEYCEAHQDDEGDDVFVFGRVKEHLR